MDARRDTEAVRASLTQKRSSSDRTGLSAGQPHAGMAKGGPAITIHVPGTSGNDVVFDAPLSRSRAVSDMLASSARLVHVSLCSTSRLHAHKDMSTGAEILNSENGKRNTLSRDRPSRREGTGVGGGSVRGRHDAPIDHIGPGREEGLGLRAGEGEGGKQQQHTHGRKEENATPCTLCWCAATSCFSCTAQHTRENPWPPPSTQPTTRTAATTHFSTAGAWRLMGVMLCMCERVC